MSNWVDAFFELNPDAVQYEEVKKTKKAASTLTLAMELPAMDFRDMDFYKNLSEEHKKEISHWVLMRYMSSSQSSSEHHLLAVNDFVNVNFSAISHHPELQWKLLALCGTGKKQFHPWIPPPRGAKKNKLEQALISLNPLLKDDDLELIQQINTQEEFEAYFRDNGFDEKAINEIFKNDSKSKK